MNVTRMLEIRMSNRGKVRAGNLKKTYLEENEIFDVVAPEESS